MFPHVFGHVPHTRVFQSQQHQRTYPLWQVRVGNQLRKLKKTTNGLDKLGLVDHVIDRFQNYYGMAIRSNIGDLEKMKKAIFAGLFHVCSSFEEN